MYRFDGSTVLVIHIDVTHTVTHQTTHILPPAGTQNALGESHKKASTQQATRRTGVLARCRRAHCARFGRWRSQKHRCWPSTGVSGGGRDLQPYAEQPNPGPTTQPNPKSTILLLGPQGLRLDCPVGRRLYSRDPEGEALAKTALWLYFRGQIFGSSDPQELKPKWQKLALTILFVSTGGEPSFLDR